MCFSVNVNLVKEELEKRYGVGFPDEYRYEPSYYYHAFGLPDIPAICSDNPKLMRVLKWGLIPPWIKNNKEAEIIRFKTFNARAETIDVKPSFVNSFRSKRCLIPVKGFFEWQDTGHGKIPWYIYSKNNELLTLAGLFSEWESDLEGTRIATFTIITTDANDLMAEIHNTKKRMPVILDRDDEKKWMDIGLDHSEAKSLLKPCLSEVLNAHTISPLVNSRKRNLNTQEVINKYSWDNPGLLF